MKKILLILSMSTFLNLFSQEYTPLLKEGNIWHIIFYDTNYDQCLFLAGNSSYRYKIDGEATINGKNYKRIITEFASGNPTPIRFCGDVLQGNLAALLREDIAERKVYRYNSTTNTETLLYDFSVQVNDPVPVDSFDAKYCGCDRMVKSVGFGNVFNTNVKYFEAVSLTDVSNYGFIYEGIGSFSGLLEEPNKLNLSYGNRMNCFENTSGVSCNSQLVLGTSENTVAKNINLYYSKEHQNFKILGESSHDFTVEFYEASGKLTEEIKTKGNQNFVLKNNVKSKILFYIITYQSHSWKGKILIP